MAYIHLQPSVVIFTVYHGLQGHETACLGTPRPSSSWFHQAPTSSWPGFRSAGGVSLPLPMESNNYWQPFCLNHLGFIRFGCPQNFPGNNLIITWPFWVSAPIYKPPSPHSTFMSVHGEFLSCYLVWIHWCPQHPQLCSKMTGEGRGGSDRRLQMDPLNNPKCCCQRKHYFCSQTAHVFLVIRPWFPVFPLPYQEVQGNSSSKNSRGWEREGEWGRGKDHHTDNHLCLHFYCFWSVSTLTFGIS